MARAIARSSPPSGCAPVCPSRCRPASDLLAALRKKARTVQLPRIHSRRQNRAAGRAGGRSTGGLQVVALGVSERADALGEQGHVERLLEDLAEAVLRQLLRGSLVLAGQADDQRGLVGGVLAEVRRDLDRLAAAQRQVNYDRVRMERLGQDAGLQTALGDFVLVILVIGQ